MPEYLVGVDGGGTKTDFVVADLTGKILAQSSHSPTGLTTNGLGIAAFNLREGLRLAFEKLPPGKIKVMVAGISGLDTMQEEKQTREVFTEVLSNWEIEKLVLINDGIVALANGNRDDDVAMVLVGGTGSNCLGYNQREGRPGKIAKAGGLDYILADDGSGYDAGRLTLKAVVRAADGRGAPTSLEPVIYQYFQVNNIDELKSKVYNPALMKGEIANLAEICAQAASDGDVVAAEIIDYCLQQLLLMAQAVALKLSLTETNFPLVVVGSFLTNLLPQFESKLELALPQAELVVTTDLPVFGALKIAKKILAGQQLRIIAN